MINDYVSVFPDPEWTKDLEINSKVGFIKLNEWEWDDDLQWIIPEIRCKSKDLFLGSIYKES